jgi:glycosyltransferase involved in cell wall biosynthesis
MRILHLIDSGGVYGAERVLLALMEGQRRLGATPILGSIGLLGERDKPIEIEARARSLDVAAIRLARGPLPTSSFALLRAARDLDARLVHTHGYKANVLLAAVPRSWRPTPIVTTVHGWCAPRGWSRLRVYEAAERRLLPRLDACAFVARSTLQDPRVPLRRISRAVVVPNGFDWRPADPPSRDDPLARFCATRPVVGSFGRLSQEKKLDAIVEAVARLRERGRPVRLALVGEGPERPLLESLVTSHGLRDHVLLPGYVPRVERYLACLDAYVLASTTEGMPMTILEAMFAGVPIVSTRVGAVPEVLQDGRGGLLLDRPDAERLADALD